jgi:hypothetical protein
VIALGFLFTPGARCSQPIFRRYRPSFAPICSYQPFRAPKLTKPHQGFICIIPSNLALACTLNLASKVLRHLTSSADTALVLLQEHSEADICLNTDRERASESFPTPPNDFRVARLTLDYAEIIRYNTLQRGIIQNEFVITPYLERYAENFSA